jgi:hypothetical protein
VPSGTSQVIGTRENVEIQDGLFCEAVADDERPPFVKAALSFSLHPITQALSRPFLSPPMTTVH